MWLIDRKYVILHLHYYNAYAQTNIIYVRNKKNPASSGICIP